MITLHDLSFFRGTRVIFNAANLTLHANHKIGLMGNNGSGKTTLFELIRGQLSADTGHIQLSTQLSIAHLDQTLPDSALPALQFTIQGDQEYQTITQALALAEKNEDYTQLVTLHSQLADIDGYTMPARAAKILSGLGFSATMQQQAINELSGGWRMRAKLARILLSRADLLLLDEPTNHLDLEAISWLERWLQSYVGSLLLISHDRDFLDNVVTQVVHLRDQQFKLYNGNYSSFETQRAEELALQQATYQKQQANIKHMMDFVDRFRANSNRARQAQSRLKAIERLPLVAAVQQDSPFQFEFLPPERCPNLLVKLENADIGYDQKTVFKRLNWQIERGARIGLLGPNGHGKSTFLRSLIGQLPLLQGTRTIDRQLAIGYFAQNQLEQLDVTASALAHMQRLAATTRGQVLRQYLGQFGFTQTLAETPIGQCSGGEKARLVLALIVWQRPALLVLDEPTNHLDLTMRNALALALQSYQGALIVVSHDRYLLRSSVNELWLAANQTLTPFAGDLTDYQKQVTT